MRFPELHFHWQWRLRASPERLWPFVADTNRFNRDTGIPVVRSVADSGQPRPADNGRHLLRYSRFGVPFEWEEEPFEWLEPVRFSVRRRFRKGPMITFRADVQLTSQVDGGTILTYSTWARPSNLVGLVGLPFGIGLISYRAFDAAFRRYDQLAPRAEPAVVETSRSRLAPAGEARLARIEQQLAKDSGLPTLVARLVDFVRRGDDVTLTHLRPYALADAWGESRRQVLVLCLWATRAGLFDLQWDILCPLCRGARASHSSLSEMTGGVHCETCNIDVSTNFERSVELTFRPSEAIRRVEDATFCVAGPRVTPHVAAQQLLAPNEQRELAPRLEPGRYRVRVLGQVGGQFLRATPSGPTSLLVQASGDGWLTEEVDVGLTPTLHLVNATKAERLFILERAIWSDQATTAAEVTTLQIFRDLFSNEILRLGEQISVGNLTVLFTDLRDSTRLYRHLGDAPAFGRVFDHFQVLRDEIDREDGTVVKTIGDAVMAVFRRPASALQAILRAQERLANPPDGSLPLALKVGLHHGPCIAVTLNDRLDYFGSVVNLAARLEHLSSGTNVVVSDAVRNDPEVDDLLATPTSRLQAERFDASLKGFDDGEFVLWRLCRQTAGVAEPVPG